MSVMDRALKAVDSVVAQIGQDNSYWTKAAVWLSLPTAGYLTARFVDEYQGWLRMGRGGLPYNFYGYCYNLYLTFRFGRRDTMSTYFYDRPDRYSPAWDNATREERLNAQKSWLPAPLPVRPGPRSRAIHYCAPQREKNAGEYLDPELKQAYMKAFEDLVKTNSESVEWRTSVLERRGRAMFLKDTYALPNPLATARRELAHLHDSDISGHILLSFGDAKEVLSKGWGERHRVAGTIAPLGYMILYQPRNLGELEMFLNILKAAIAYGKSNGRNGGKDKST
ncbi:hypothetical protein GE09DRAFT_1195592 [Coniochaeta sp. 2T2.1]|nr:hypothetical protein GE09DRAFT_1195592 [Coniochaeta sp. 2T2.1]